MADSLETFWPEDIIPQEKVLTPVLILRQVAGELSQKSRNLYEGVVESEEAQSDSFDNEYTLRVHTLYVVVPGLDRYSRSLLKVVHDVDEVYPAYISETRCNSQYELKLAIQKRLSAPETKAIFYSLAAKLNEVSVAN